MIWLRIGLFRRFQHTAARRRLAQQIPLNVSIASSFNTQPPEGGWFSLRPLALLPTWFQHTAARRRLAYQTGKAVREEKVSTHSRPKAAGKTTRRKLASSNGFNTQPPEGGWAKNRQSGRKRRCFNTQPPEGGWPSFKKSPRRI